MIEYWESRYKNEGAMWKSEPADSALFALELFKSYGINSILIPGIGYGRNAKLFLDSGFKVTGIEISESAINLAKARGLNCNIYHGSVTLMPYENEQYGGIYCYALIHLLNKTERRTFLNLCYNQLEKGGLMIFIVASKQMSLYGCGKYLSKDRYKITKGLKVFFYDSESVIKEFSDFGMIEFRNTEEPIKFMEGEEPIKMICVICKRTE
jgi:2-polyprenyl-3-methyl-5-hydroxy-6-metoxy-1,4-benzoquinol methylase